MSRARSSSWLVSPAADLLVGCGGWSIPLIALATVLQARHAAALGFGFYALGLFCNNPHYMATLERAYGRADDFHKYRFFTVYVSILCLATIVLAHLFPVLFPWLVTLYLTWSPWHYTGQNFGIAQMFVRRSGAGPDPRARSLLWWGYAASYGGWFLELNAHRDASDPYFLSLDLPDAVARPLILACAAAFVFCTAASLRRTARASSARAILAPAVMSSAQLMWFIVPALVSKLGGATIPASYFSAGILAFMHCAQYLWITTAYARRDASGARRPFSFGRYYGGLVIGGIALFVPGPWIASRLLGRDFVESFMIFMALVNLHHFIVDGAIWKLRDGRIARLLLGDSSGATRPEGAIERKAAAAISGPQGMGADAGKRRSWAWIVLAAGLTTLALIDQTQYFLTLEPGSPAWLAKAEILNPADPRVPFRRASLFLASGNLAGAASELGSILARNPRNAPALRMLAEVSLRSGDRKGALAAYDRLAEFYSEDIVVAMNRGLLDRELGRPAEAVRRYREALRISPERVELHYLLGDALHAAGEPRAAIEQYAAFTDAAERSESETPGGVAAYVQASLALGELNAAQGDRSEAIRRLRRAADLASTHHDFRTAADALGRLAAVEEAAGQKAEAGRDRALAAKAAAFQSEPAPVPN